MGDFNCRQGSAPYEVFVGDNNTTDPDLLKNSFEDPNIIDWILLKGSVIVIIYEDVGYNVNCIYPSDHKPVFVEFELPDK